MLLLLAFRNISAYSRENKRGRLINDSPSAAAHPQRLAFRPVLDCLLACVAILGLAVEARSQDLATDRTGLKALNNDQQTAFISTGAGSGLFVPVILTASGLNNSYYTSELTLTNRGSHAATLRYTYRAADGGGSGTASETLAPGRQKIVPDAIAYLGTLGIPIPDTGNRIGTLQVEVSGSAEVGVTVRTTTRVANGRVGLAYPGIAAAAGFTEAVYLCGLRQNTQDRSNVAVQNMGTAAQGDVTLRTTVFSGDPENSGSQSLGEVTLAPGGFRQFNGILATVGFSNGYVRVERVGGTAPFYAYAVINDQANSDGSFVFPVTASSLTGTKGQTLPVIVETGVFTSELIVTNFSASAKVIDFRFVAEAIESADRTARFSLTLAPGAQRIIPEIVEELRRQGVAGVGLSGRTLAGALFATERRENLSGVVIGARTGSPGGGGQYSVFYNAVPDGAGFSDTAWIEALQQNRDNRSNLALVNTGEVDDSPSVFQLDIYAGETGQLVNTVTGLRVAARGWRQINGILDKYAPGTTQGYVRISKIAGNNPFLAYGVINDGGAPGQRSGDGSYLPATETIHDPGTDPGTGPGTDPMTDREVLEALYHATGGPKWRDPTNWLSDLPLSEWFGVGTDGTGRVTSLFLSGNQLSGPIPPELGSLTNLQRLDLGGRWDSTSQKWIYNQVSGPIPPELGSLANLQSLSLEGNQLSGPIPPELGSLANLQSLSLEGNQLSGPIPPELGSLASLQRLSLRGNQLSGPIPPELGSLANLQSLNLGGNQLISGSIPPELGSLANLQSLSLEGNQLSGPIPPELGSLSSLQRLSLGGNQLSGPIPPELGSLANLQSLSLRGNQLSGVIPAEFGNLTNLKYLFLGSNELTGPIPHSFLQLNELRSFYTAWNDSLCVPGISAFVAWLQRIENRDEASITCNAADVTALKSLFEVAGGADWTNSTGWLADPAVEEWHGVSADSLGHVTQLDLTRNGLTGRLPASLGHLARMTELRIGDNPDLSGRLPLSLADLSLRALVYSGTGLCAPVNMPFRDWLSTIPSHEGTGAECPALSDREILEVLYDVTGGPNWTNNENWLSDAPLGDWHGVDVDGEGRVTSIELWANALAGFLPPELGGLSRLMNLGIGGTYQTRGYRTVGNGVTGRIPPELGNLSELRSLSLHYNDLTGVIPPSFGNLANLRFLHLGTNPRLTGEIPPELGNLPNLRFLVIDYSDMTGPIPPALANLANLKALILNNNDLTGSIPSALGRLVKLEKLTLERNRLTGSIPAELGGLANLQILDLGRNRLTGTLAPDLGQLSQLTHLLVSNNALTGPLPDGFGGLTSLQRLELTNNAGMSGSLPSSLTALSRLAALLAGGTGLCSPTDSRFLTWLEGVHKRRIASCANNGVSQAYLTQSVQSREFPVPLVANRRALVRVFPTARETTAEGIPAVRANFYLNGTPVHTADIPAKATSIPTEVREGSLATSANAEIPASVVQPGLEMVVEIDPDGTLDAALGVTERIPETGRMAIDVRAMPTLDLTLVPFLWSEKPDSTILDIVEGLAPEDELFWMTRTLLPVGDFDLSAHEPVLSSSNHVSTLKRETEAIWVIEGRRGHYVGTIAGEYTGTRALGSLVTRVMFTVLGSSIRDPEYTMAHELGHTMSLGHTPCGGGHQDPSYPYSKGAIGVWGYDFRDGGSVVAPFNRDLMSYCGTGHWWISDYHFTNALRYRLVDEGAPTASVAVHANKSLLLWGGVDSEGEPYLEPAFVVDAPPALPDSAGQYTISGRTADGAELFSISFAMPETADGDASSSFAFVLPVRTEWEGNLASISLTGPGGAVTLDRNTNRPVTILRNPQSGQIRGILRDRTPAALDRDNAASVLDRDNAVSALVREELGLEVLTSRGIPDPDDWTQ